MAKTKEELTQLKQEYKTLTNKLKELSDDEIGKIVGGEDTDSLKFSGKPVPLPKAKSKKKCDGGYDGNIIIETGIDETVSKIINE